MAETPGGIPNRAWFRASEVCEIAGIRPYVLRSWEAEFPSLGVSRGHGRPRVYRREDVELVLRIKQMVVGEGLTLAGVRRRMEGELSPDAESVALVEVFGPEVRQRVSEVRQGLRSLLDLLSPEDGSAAAGPAPLPFDEGSDEDFGAVPEASAGAGRSSVEPPVLRAAASGPGNPGTPDLAGGNPDLAGGDPDLAGGESDKTASSPSGRSTPEPAGERKKTRAARKGGKPGVGA